MALLSLQDATLILGRRRIFSEIGLRIGDGERIGLIGPNGSGKTSLLRLIAGELELDGGSVHRKRGLRVGYLPQEIHLAGDGQLLEFVRTSVPGRDELDAELATTEAQMAVIEDTAEGETRDDQLLEMSVRLADLHERIDHFDSFWADHVALRILAGLGFHDADHTRSLNELSGGWRMRAVLAALLFMQPDVLLMDEPTNHLDMPSVAWFAGFLKRYTRAFVLISHDREFLNEQISKVISFEPEGLRAYTGDYERYLKQRAEERIVLENRAKNLKRERDKAQEFIDRFRYQATKAKAVQSRIKALERMEQVEALGDHQIASFRFPPTSRTSKLVLKAEGLAKSYGDLHVFSDVDLSVNHGEKIGVIGVNGAGKTTLLRVLANELQASAGEIQLGAHVNLGFYAQHHTETLNDDSTVFDEVSRNAKGVTPLTVRTLLGTLLFSGDDVDKPVRVLSGGEKARVALARLLLSPRNLLLMDEPTNHLDLASSERLAAALSTFDGTLIFVSHNRSFIRSLATRIWNVQDGKVETYPGTLDEYMQSAVRQLEVADGSSAQPTRQSGGAAAEKSRSRVSAKERRRREAEQRAHRRKHLGPLQDEVAELERRIGEIEVLQAERSALLSDADVYADAERSAELTRAYRDDADSLDELNSAWEKVSLKLEAATGKLEAMASDDGGAA